MLKKIDECMVIYCQGFKSHSQGKYLQSVGEFELFNYGGYFACYESIHFIESGVVASLVIISWHNC